MALLSRDQILDADDIKYEELPVPEWGGSVRLKSLAGEERDAFEASTVESKGGKTKANLANLRARLVSRCVVNEEGLLLFSPPDIKLLGKKSAAALDRVFSKCQEMNALTEKDVEELTEGFDDARSEPSTSG